MRQSVLSVRQAVAGPVVALGLGLLAACESPPRPAPPPPEVIVATPATRTVTTIHDFNGTTEAYESVEIRARVQGFQEKIEFVASSFVDKDQLLFVIEQAPFIAARDRADASLKSAEAALRRAESDLDRLEQAVKTNAVSQQEVTRARAERDQADAALMGAGSALESAAIELAYTTVRSPIHGLITRNLVDRGNLVGQGGSTLLATVRRIDPIYVYFEINERQFARILDVLGGHQDPAERQGEDPTVPATLMLRETGHEVVGRLDSMDNTVDTATGTIMVRGVFPNPKALIFPGFFVTVRLTAEPLEDATLIPERAIGTDLGGKYVYLVAGDNVVEQRYVELGPTQDDGTVVILEGLAPEERFVLDGLLRARPGLPVTPKAADEGEQR